MRLLFVVSCLGALVVSVSSSQGDPCEDASQITMSGRSEVERQTVISSCRAAFADPDHRSQSVLACRRHADLVEPSVRFLASYTCSTATIMAAPPAKPAAHAPKPSPRTNTSPAPPINVPSDQAERDCSAVVFKRETAFERKLFADCVAQQRSLRSLQERYRQGN